MRNLRFTKGKVGLRRIAALSVAAAGVAMVTAAVFPAQGAAARHRHNVARARVRVEQHALRVQGTEANDAIALRLAAGNPTVLQVDLGDNGTADFSFPRAAIKSISVEARGGNDRVRIDDANGTFTDAIPTRIAGGPGNDTIAGGVGREMLIGGPGNDTIDGNGGNDVSDLGPGDDTFVWDPGDGSDTIEGGPGTDSMEFNGAAASETVDLSANGNRLRFFRSPANITMDTHGVEQVDFNALGGADTVTVNDLSRTDVKNVNVDLAGTGGTTGDGQADRVVVNGTPLNDAINVAGDTSGVTVFGLRTEVSVQHQEPTDQLFVQGLGGDDSISAIALAAGAASEFIEGGDGNDSIAGGPGARRSSAATATTRSTATAAATALLSGPAATRSSGIRATAATRSRARTARTRWCSTAPLPPRRSTFRRTGPAAVLPQPGERHDGHPRGRAGCLQRARRRRQRDGQRPDRHRRDERRPQPRRRPRRHHG